MQLFMDVLFVLILVFFSCRLILGLKKMKRKVIFPADKKEMEAIRKYPQKSLDFPAEPQRKTSIMMYSFLIILIFIIFTLVKITGWLDWPLYPLLLLPFIINSENILNVFAIQEDGILDRGRFIRWEKIKTYRFISIDMNHKFYGYTEEVNNGYELIVDTKGFPIRCSITSEEMKEKLDSLLREHTRETNMRGNKIETDE